jgi:hypothetical protein
VSLSALVAAPLLMVAPAYATTIDVAGYRLNFDNAVDQEILENAELNDSYLYENIATVNGVQIDAEVTVVGMSENSLGNYPHEPISEAQIDILNADNTEHVDVAGCYSNDDYVAAYEAEEAYDFLGFNAPGSLKGGFEVEYIDGYEDDPEWEHTISTGLDLCDPGYTGEVDGYVEINVEFQVNGEPVTLTNVSITAHDIDGEQQVQFWDPVPTSSFTSDDSLVTIEDFSDTDGYLQFTGPEESSEDGFEARYIAEVSYDSVSDFTYSFLLNNQSGGSLQLEFESYFNGDGDLASTGVDSAPAGIAGLAVLGLGSALVIARRVRRNRA